MKLRRCAAVFVVVALAWASASMAEDRPASWLLVTNAQSFDFDGRKIILKGVSPDVVAFTDRPNRVVRDIAPSEFIKIWKDGQSEAFANDPPNAVLSVEGRLANPVILELSNPVLTGDALTFDASVLSGTLPTNGGSVSMVVDSLGQSIPLF